MTAHKDTPAVIQISWIWVDVMRIGLLTSGAKTTAKTDAAKRPYKWADWWLEHQKEIAFTLGVFEGLGLANKIATTKDGRVILWAPSRQMERLYRDSRPYCGEHDPRDAGLQESLAARLSGDNRFDLDDDLLDPGDDPLDLREMPLD